MTGGRIEPSLSFGDAGSSLGKPQHDLNLRPSGYEQPQGTSQPVTATDNPSQSLPHGDEDRARSVQPAPTLRKDFGPPVVPSIRGEQKRIAPVLSVREVAARLGVSKATV